MSDPNIESGRASRSDLAIPGQSRLALRRLARRAIQRGRRLLADLASGLVGPARKLQKCYVPVRY